MKGVYNLRCQIFQPTPQDITSDCPVSFSANSSNCPSILITGKGLTFEHKPNQHNLYYHVPLYKYTEHFQACVFILALCF